MHPFRNLLLISLGRETAFRKDPTPKDWETMFRMARQQALIGVCYEGICRVPDSQKPSQGVLDTWRRLAEKIGDIYRLHLQRTQELEGILSRLGLRGCILKGTALSRFYPVPESRMCGDIDVWVAGTHKSILAALHKEYETWEVLYQECKVDFFKDVDMEIHFHPGKMYNPFLNARYQRYLEKESPIREDAVLTLADLRFHAVYCMGHMFHHYLEGGIGLRQMMDYYFLLLAMDPADRKPVMDALKHLGMGKFTAALMESLKFNFGLEEEYFLCAPDPKLGRKLMEAAIYGGNFGIRDKRNYHKKTESRLYRYFRKTSRVLSYLGQYPREVAWAPYARIKHYFWRLFRGYL